MISGTASPHLMQAASVLTGATMALWLLVGQVHRLREHVGKIRAALLIFYLAVAVAFVLYVMFGGPRA